MKLEVELLSVNQVVDFKNGGQVRQFVRVNLLGADVDIEVTEEQMQQITEKAVALSIGPYSMGSSVAPEEVEHTTTLNWEDTREAPSEADLARVSSPQAEEREFSYSGGMGQLVDQDLPEVESESAKEQALRARRPAQRTASDDDAFSQG